MSFTELQKLSSLGSSSQLAEYYSMMDVSNGWMAVGNAFEDSLDGKVFLYQMNEDNEWVLQATLSGPVGEASYFGWCVEFDVTAERLFVGNCLKDVSGVEGAGEVKMYTRSGTTWTLKLTIDQNDTADSPGDSDRFGYCIRVNDAATKLYVSAPFRDIGATLLKGKVYEFDIGGTLASPTLTETSASPITHANTRTRAGVSLAITADGQELFVGAQASGSSNGAIFYYKYSGGAWVETQELLPRISNAGSYFGRNVAVSENGLRLVAGRSDFRSQGGQIQYYARADRDTSWSLRAEWMYNGGWATGSNTQFGWCLSMNRGGTRFVVGQPLTSSGLIKIYKLDTSQDYNDDYLGAHSLYDQNSGCWISSGAVYQEITPSTTYSSGRFGNCVVMNRQGNLIIAAQGKSNVNGSGTVYTYTSTASNFFFHGITATAPTPVASSAGTALTLPRSYSFVNNGGSGYDYESMDVTYVSTDGFASGSSVHTWKKDGSDIGALLLNSTSYIDIGSPIEDISSLGFYFCVRKTSYAAGTVTIDFSGNDGVEISGSSANIGGYEVSYTDQTVSIVYPESAPSNLLYISITFSSPVVLSENIPITFE